MRIYIFTEVYEFGGPDTVLAEVLQCWPAPADEFIVVTNRYYERYRPLFAKRLRRAVQWVISPSIDRGDLLRRWASRPWQVPARAILFLAQYPLLLWNAARLTKLFQQLGPDVLLINNGGYPGADTCRAAVLAAARSGISRVILVVHNLPVAPRPWRWLPEQVIDRYIDRHAQMVCVSESSMALLRKVRAFRQSGVVIPNGFTPPVSYISRDELVQEFGVPPQSYLISMVAGYDPRKGHHLLFESVATLRHRFPDIRVLLFGTGKPAQIARLQSLMTHQRLDGMVVSCGFRHNVTAYLGATDLLVLPAVAFESLPMAIIEAMALRVPVIASDVGGIRELIEDGVTGRLLPPGDVAALTAAIEQAIEHPESARQWAERAWAHYRAKHTGEVMARSYYKLLAGAAGGGAGEESGSVENVG